MELYQKENNSIWYTEDKLVCCVCNRATSSVMEIKTDTDSFLACYLTKRNHKAPCYQNLLGRLLAKNISVQTRLILNESFENKRKTVGLSLRYDILERDNFKCVLCGKDAKITTLEIDHIIPVIAGGKTTKENLRTLCFDCNRGKKDK